MQREDEITKREKQVQLRHHKKNKMTELHKVLLPEKIMKMLMAILIFMLAMPMTMLIMLIVLRTITVTLPRPPMVTIDLMCMVMKEKMLMMIKRKPSRRSTPKKGITRKAR